MLVPLVTLPATKMLAKQSSSRDPVLSSILGRQRTSMPRMIDVIRSSGASSNVMQTAARGALHVPASEMIEILVYLATQTKIFAERARLTLAGWDEASSRAAAADPRTPKEVLAYMIAPGNLRPALLPALLENPAVAEQSLADLAASASRYLLETLFKSARINQSETILSSLNTNPHLNPTQSAAIAEKLSALKPSGETEAASTQTSAETAPPAEQAAEQAEEPTAPNSPASEPGADEVPDQAITAYMAEHAGEISTDADKPFQPIGGIDEVTPASYAPQPDEAPVEAKTEAVASSTHHAAATAARKAPTKKKIFLSAEEE